ncbi:hypothetical protein ACFL48_03360 [Pseudomonadota bacterium]
MAGQKETVITVLNAPIKPIRIGGHGSRISLSTVQLRRLGWDAIKDDFKCYGFFKQQGELLCAPVDYLRNEDGSHPFDSVLEYREIVSPGANRNLEDMPALREILAPSRIIEFDATWVNDKRLQLNLNVGVDVVKWLIGQKNGSVFPSVWEGIITLSSQERHNQAMNEDFTSGLLNI